MDELIPRDTPEIPVSGACGRRMVVKLGGNSGMVTIREDGLGDSPRRIPQIIEYATIALKRVSQSLPTPP